MSGGLVRKEIHELRPFVLLASFLLLLDLGEWLLLQTDMQPLSVGFEDVGMEFAGLMFFLAFAVGSGLLVREMDDRTLGFLDGLPVTRLRVFTVKTLVAAAVLLLYPLGGMLMLVGQHLVARQSLDYAVHATLLWQAGAMMVVVTAVGLSMGMLLGFLRNLCWLALAAGAIALAVATRFSPELAVFNPLKLLDVRLVGIEWKLPLTGLGIQLAVWAFCTALAVYLFITASGGRGRRLQVWLSRPLVSAAVIVATIGALITAFALLVAPSEDSPELGGEGAPPVVQFAPSPVSSARTEHYSFTFNSQQAEQVQRVLREADAVYARVATLLGAASGARIDVDLTGSMQNTEGTAFYDRIRMHLGGEPVETLAHETAHVLARRLAGGERERELSKMGAFNEGLAEWIANTVMGQGGVTADERLTAAIVSQRHLVRPEHLTDMQALARNADLALQYPLGAALVDALVLRYGAEAPRKLLLTLGDPDFPRDLVGNELWFAAFQAAGFDLALVFDDYSRRLRTWETEFAAQIASLPRPRGSLVYRDASVGVELRLDQALPPGWRPVVRFRPAEDSPLDLYSLSEVDDGMVAWRNSGYAVNGRLCFQPGVSALDVTILEAWVCLPLDVDQR